jgi:hypothetical protein
MIDLALLSSLDESSDHKEAPSGAKLAESRRPAILTYASPLVDTANRFWRLPFYVFGWKREAQTLRVTMMEGVEFTKGKKNVPAALRLEIQSLERMQIYSATVRCDARFKGLRYVQELPFFRLQGSPLDQAPYAKTIANDLISDGLCIIGEFSRL